MKEKKIDGTAVDESVMDGWHHIEVQRSDPFSFCSLAENFLIDPDDLRDCF